MYKHAARESGLIVCAAIVLGFSYTAFTGKGFFGKGDSVDSLHTSVTGPAPATISLAEAKSLFDSGQALFVDSRHAFDFRMGHIESAINIPLNKLDSESQAIATLPRNKTIVVYCDGSECNSSIELAAKLYERGIGGLKIFFGGWEEWTANKYPTETGS
jgi:rhodanese-related sulfurtransferase